jgi:hypothetical protein
MGIKLRLCVAHFICVRLEGHAEHRDGFILRADIGEADLQEVRY